MFPRSEKQACPTSCRAATIYIKHYLADLASTSYTGTKQRKIQRIAPDIKRIGYPALEIVYNNTGWPDSQVN